MTEVLLRPPTSCSPSKLSSAFYVLRGSADYRWRVELPARHLKAKVVSMNEKDGKKALTNPSLEGKFPWVPTDDGAIYPHSPEVAIWTRPCMVRATHAAAMSANGIRTLAEVDDNYLSDPSQNIFMRMNNYNAYGRRSHMQAFASFDGIIYSTEWLKNEYEKTMKKELGFHPEGFVARNHVDPEDWKTRRNLLPPKERIRVGWMGSHQHVIDLRLAAPALRLAKDMGCEIVIVGLNPADHDPKWSEFLGDYTHIPWCSPKLYHRSILNFDIGLIPLVYTKHTMGKSDVKFIEYAMSGAATVASSHPVYNKTIKHGETGLLAASPDEMAYAMADLIKNSRYRQEIADAAKQQILETRTMAGQGAHEWREAVEG